MQEHNQKIYDQAAEQFTRNYLSADISQHIERVVGQVTSGGRLLDLGCGPGRDLQYFSQKGFEVVGLDLSRGLLQQAQQRTGADLVQANTLALPLAAESFDGVWACASLLHIPRTQINAVLADVRRVLRPGGWFYLAVKRGAGERMVPDRQGERFFVFYELEEIRKLVFATGFAIEDGWTNESRTASWVNVLGRRG